VARRRLQELSAWRRRELTIPPDSFRAWVELGVWESRMGMFLYVALAFGTQLIVTAPASIVPVFDFTACYAASPIAQPCERIAYRVGTLNAALNVWCGLLLLAGAAWLVCVLWSAVAPKPITDEFLKLLDDSFARDWRKPSTWPWMRAVWAYGFTLVGATAAACIGLLISAVIASSGLAKTPTGHVKTSESFKLIQSS
jgi:hypothetical protein